VGILPHWLGGKKHTAKRASAAQAEELDAPERTAELLEEAVHAEEAGETERAVKLLKDVFCSDAECPIDESVLTPERKAVIARAALEAGIALITENRWENADAALRRAARLLPDWAPPYVNMAYLQMRRANPEAAIALYRKAIELDPPAPIPRSYLLFTLNMSDAVSPEETFIEHRRYGEWLAGVTGAPSRDHANSPDPERVLRVGYVSADFRIHPVAQFLDPLLGDHDPSQVDFVCYSNTKDRDELTRELERRYARNWRDVVQLTDDQLADLVVQDEIDVLVDLSGHTGDSRLPVFARKPAPIQLSWLGYLNTTGLTSMDYRLVDRHTDPMGMSERWHTERLVRLPESQWAYWPMFEMPMLPRKRTNNPERVVFSSQNQFAKVSDRCLKLWAQILSKLPNAQLRIASVPPGRGASQILERLERFGISSDRVETVGRVPMKKYLAAFNEIDVALDSMPYNGATTVLDTLWMGVPIVALVGDRSISRGTYSILKTLGRDDLIAETPEKYVDLNVSLATDIEWRSELHRTLREQLQRSPLMDISRFTEDLEAVYRTMWHEWCATRSIGTNV